MSISDDKRELERTARQDAIKKTLESDADSKAEPAVAEDGSTVPPASSQPTLSPPLRPWERVINGRREQYRPMTSREVEAESDRQFMESQRRQDEAHAEKIAAAIREAEREQKRLDQKREQEERTGRRPMGKDTISLEEARRRGYLASENASQGKPEWHSAGNPDGIFCGGR